MTEGGASTLSIDVNNGNVIFRFPKEVKWVELDPETARQMGEALARASYEAKYGKKPTVNKSLIIDQIRTRLHTHCTHMIRSMTNQNILPGKIAQEVVDYVLSEAT